MTTSAIRANVMRTERLNAEKVEAVFLENGQTTAKWAGVYVGNDDRSKRRRVNESLSQVRKMGRLYDDPLPTPVVEGICLDACRQVNEIEQAIKLADKLDLVHTILADLDDSDIDAQHEWGEDVVNHEVQPGLDGQSHTAFAKEAVEAAVRALAKYKWLLLRQDRITCSK
jgi:hypothetical protein